jgi:hypothetical protein
MPIERPDPDAGAFGHSFETRLRAAGAKNAFRGFQYALAIARSIGTRLAIDFCR